MKKSVCGIDCNKCDLKENCEGCETMSKNCVVANCCKAYGKKVCDCKNDCNLKMQLIKEFNAFKVKGMPKVTTLNALRGDFVNLGYKLANGQLIKLLEDDKIYLGNQFSKNDEKCYGIVGDENILLVCEYGLNGADAEIVLYKKR